jgi:hypothetical protein
MTLNNVFIWLLGVAIGNALMDVMTVIRLATVRPTLYGVARAIRYVPYLYVPKSCKGFNTYFAILFSWLTAAGAFIAIIVLFIAKNANNSNGTTQQQ